MHTDLVNWSSGGKFSGKDGEGPYVFFWKNYYWCIQDPVSNDGGLGLTVRRSSDGMSWTKQANILGGSGTRKNEVGMDGKHVSVAVLADRAYVIYFVGPGKTSWLEAAPLSLSNSGVLSANRTDDFEFMLKYYEDPNNEGR